MKMRKGFTLAEVLITLGIIGVVAAMTIPTLIANTNSAKFRSQFKKTLSTLNQAGLMGEAQFDLNYGSTEKKCGDTLTSGHAADAQNPNSDSTFCALLNGTLTGQRYVGNPTATNLGVSAYDPKPANETDDNGSLIQPAYADDPVGGTGTGSTGGDSAGQWSFTATDYVAYTLADGSMVAFHKDAAGCVLDIGTPLTAAWIAANPTCLGFIDVNGATLPNKEVKCSDTGKTTELDPATPCTVKADANHMTDIYPVVFHDATVEPASNAAKYVLTTAK